MSTLAAMYQAQANSPSTTIAGDITNAQTEITVADASIFPQSVPFLLTLGSDVSQSETVLVTEANGLVITVERGWDGPAQQWLTGTKIARVFTARDHNTLIDNIELLNTEKAEAADLETHVSAAKPHLFLDENNVAYRYGFRSQGGNLIFEFEEVE